MRSLGWGRESLCVVAAAAPPFYVGASEPKFWREEPARDSPVGAIPCGCPSVGEQKSRASRKGFWTDGLLAGGGLNLTMNSVGQPQGIAPTGLSRAGSSLQNLKLRLSRQFPTCSQSEALGCLKATKSLLRVKVM